MSKTISFAPDTIVTLEDNKIAVRGQGMNNYIDNENLDSFSYMEISQRTIGFVALWFRLCLLVAVTAIILIILEAIILDTATSVVAMLATGWIAGGIAPVLIFLMVFDLMLGTNVCNRLLDTYYTVKAYKVTIANKSGNNIDFYATLDEEGKLIGLKKDVELIKANTASLTNASTDLDGLRKLDGLLKDGIITREEFDVKKKQILGL